MKHVGMTGYSRDDKMATIAAAMDERIAAVIAGSTGVGGVLPWRIASRAGKMASDADVADGVLPEVQA